MKPIPNTDISNSQSWPWRNVISHRRSAKPGGYSGDRKSGYLEAHLECGHRLPVQPGMTPKQRMRCKHCYVAGVENGTIPANKNNTGYMKKYRENDMR